MHVMLQVFFELSGALHSCLHRTHDLVARSHAQVGFVLNCWGKLPPFYPIMMTPKIECRDGLISPNKENP